MKKKLPFTQRDFIKALSGFEFAASHAAADECWSELFNCIDKFQELHNHGGLSNFSVSMEQKLAIYTRFMAALAQWAARPDVKLSYQQFLVLSHSKKLLVSIANASGYCGTSHYLDLLAKTPPGTQKAFASEKLTLLFALVALDDLPTPLMDLAIQQSPTILLVYLLGALSERFVLTEQGERNRTLLLKNSEKIVDAQIPPAEVNRLLNAMASVWMYCSYAQYENKHLLKKHLNKLIIRYAFESKTHYIENQQFRRKKPRMLIIHERFTHSHAMYRCWAPVIKGLAAHFELISLGFEGYVDDCTNTIFQESIVYPKSKPLPEVINFVQSCAPDVVFYPSVGMQLQVIGLANLRLAPIQLAGTGHPATTMSENIDYILTSALKPNPETYLEKAIYSNEYSFIQHPAFVKQSLKQRNENQIIIGIHGKIMKLNNGLLRIIDHLRKHSSIELAFRFYPGEYGIYYDGANTSIRKCVANASVQNTMAYEKFLYSINECDFFINPFPFGNTNSLVDCVLLHKPVVCMFGKETHNQIDAIILQKLGLNELVAHDELSYIKIVTRLVNDVYYFNSIVKILTQVDPAEVLYGSKNEKLIDDATASMIYQHYLILHHEQ